MKFLLTTFVILLLTSCSNSDKKTSIDPKELFKDSLSRDTVAETIINNTNEFSEKPLKDQFLFEVDSVVLPEFEIELKLSDNAEKKIRTDKESIIVQAYFSGIPKDTTLEEYVEWGKISIGSSRVELYDKRVAKFENVKIANEAYELLADQNFEILINVFTGRRTSTNNLLSVETLQDGIDSIKAKRHLLKGNLIYGD